MLRSVEPTCTKKKTGHYVPGILASGDCKTLYISGQLSIDPGTGAPPCTFRQEVEQALNNMNNVLSEAGLCKDNVAMCRVYISSIQYWDELDNIYKEWFGLHRPARIVVPCGQLHYGCNVEVEAIAVSNPKE